MKCPAINRKMTTHVPTPHQPVNRTSVLARILASIVLASLAQPALSQPPAIYQATDYKGREIGHLTGDVYYARMDDYLSAFIVTDEGIVLVEPIGTEFATWLKAELDRRFGVPVKYVIYSHHHADHGSGAAVYADTARLIGHENMLRHLAMPPANTALPDNMASMDANRNGRLEQSEATGRISQLFAAYDADRNGVLSGAEGTRGPFAYVTPPDLTYTEQVNITLGGKRIEIIPIPTIHADDNTIVRFVDGSNVVFASDWITIDRVPFGPVVALPDEIEKVRRVEAMDFEIFVCSHGKLGTKADVTANLMYREAVRGEVARAISAGQTLEQVQANVLMDDFSHWEFYEQQRPLNVTGAYRSLTRSE
jgi:glyoxylase-like metal-dependent hydrolase (beta-lactamase superfamily II)